MQVLEYEREKLYNLDDISGRKFRMREKREVRNVLRKLR